MKLETFCFGEVLPLDLDSFSCNASATTSESERCDSLAKCFASASNSSSNLTVASTRKRIAKFFRQRKGWRRDKACPESVAAMRCPCLDLNRNPAGNKTDSANENHRNDF